MSIITTVHIRWHGAYSLENFYSKEIAQYKGIYAIYRIYGEKETLIYIGKTSRSFYQRINEHYKEWLWNVKGQITIRIGLLEFPNGGKFSVKKLNDVESLLIQWHTPKENTVSTVRYRGRFNLEIINFGRKGLLEKKVSASDLDWD